MYWSDTRTRTISTADMDGSNSSTLVKQLGFPFGLAIDRNGKWSRPVARIGVNGGGVPGHAASPYRGFCPTQRRLGVDPPVYGPVEVGRLNYLCKMRRERPQ